MFTIITPTIGRESLLKTCETVDAQTFEEWKHLIVFDGPECSLDILDKIKHPKRQVIFSGNNFNDYGHSLRFLTWDLVQTPYMMYLDDDDYYDPDCLEIIFKMMDRDVDFVFFPVMWHGNPCMFEPPRCGYTVSCQYTHKKFGGDGRPIRFSPGGLGTDGHWIDAMLVFHSYQVIKPYKPLVFVDVIGGKRS